MSDRYNISLRKLKDGLLWSQTTNAPFFLAVKFTDHIAIGEITEKIIQYDSEIKWGGRRDRGQNSDLELMVSIPIEQFRLLGNFNL